MHRGRGLDRRLPGLRVARAAPLSGPETRAKAGWRTRAFVAAMAASAVAWPPKARKDDDGSL